MTKLGLPGVHGETVEEKIEVKDDVVKVEPRQVFTVLPTVIPMPTSPPPPSQPSLLQFICRGLLIFILFIACFTAGLCLLYGVDAFYSGFFEKDNSSPTVSPVAMKQLSDTPKKDEDIMMGNIPFAKIMIIDGGSKQNEQNTETNRKIIDGSVEKNVEQPTFNNQDPSMNPQMMQALMMLQMKQIAQMQAIRMWRMRRIQQEMMQEALMRQQWKQRNQQEQMARWAWAQQQQAMQQRAMQQQYWQAVQQQQWEKQQQQLMWQRQQQQQQQQPQAWPQQQQNEDEWRQYYRQNFPQYYQQNQGEQQQQRYINEQRAEQFMRQQAQQHNMPQQQQQQQQMTEEMTMRPHDASPQQIMNRLQWNGQQWIQEPDNIPSTPGPAIHDRIYQQLQRKSQGMEFNAPSRPIWTAITPMPSTQQNNNDDEIFRENLQKAMQIQAEATPSTTVASVSSTEKTVEIPMTENIFRDILSVFDQDKEPEEKTTLAPSSTTQNVFKHFETEEDKAKQTEIETTTQNVFKAFEGDDKEKETSSQPVVIEDSFPHPPQRTTTSEPNINNHESQEKNEDGKDGETEEDPLAAFLSLRYFEQEAHKMAEAGIPEKTTTIDRNEEKQSPQVDESQFHSTESSHEEPHPTSEEVPSAEQHVISSSEEHNEGHEASEEQPSMPLPISA